MYEGLRDALKSRSGNHLECSFAEIELLLGRGLPKSARKYRQWWANDASHTQAAAWLSIGWEVETANLTAERVMFRKSR